MAEFGGVLGMLMNAKDEEKNRARKFKAMVEYADSAGIMPKERALTMDVDRLEGALRGVAAKVELDKAKREQEQANVEMNDRYLNVLLKAAGLNERQEDRASDTTFGKLLADAQTPPAGTGTNPPPAAVMDVFRMATTAGKPALQSSQIAENLARAMHFSTDTTERLEPNWLEDPTSGMRFLGRGKTTLPSGMNPAKATEALPQIPGFTPAPTGRGGFTWLKTPTGEVDLDRNIKLLKMQQESILKDYSLPAKDRTAKLAEIDDAIDELRGKKPGSAGTPAGSPAPAAIPSRSSILRFRKNPQTGKVEQY